MIGNCYWTMKTKPEFNKGKQILSDVLEPPSRIPDEYVLSLNSVIDSKGIDLSKRSEKGTKN